MATTDHDYAPKQWLDPVSEVEREALDKGFNRGVLFTVACFLATFGAMSALEWVMGLLMGFFL